MLVIAVVLIMIAAGCAVLVTEASRDLVPAVGRDAQLLTRSAPTDPAAETTATVRVDL